MRDDPRLGLLEQEVVSLRASLRDLLTREVQDTSSSLVWSGTGIDDSGTTVVVAGTVADVVTVVYAVAEESGTDTGGGTVTLEPGDSQVICNDGTNALTVACTAGGAVTLTRTAGAETYAASLMLVYV